MGTDKAMPLGSPGLGIMGSPRYQAENMHHMRREDPSPWVGPASSSAMMSAQRPPQGVQS